MGLHVRNAPETPTLLFDGDCGFCRRWVERWKQITGERIDYIPFQESGGRFPEVTPEMCDKAVQLVDIHGEVFSGAEAVFRSLAEEPRRRWMLRAYTGVPGAKKIADTTYAFIAQRRMFASRLTRMLWGAHVARPSYVLVRDIFLRGLGVIFLCAFISLWVQATGLVGPDGILPAERTVAGWNDYFNEQGIGWTRYLREPTWFWIGAGSSAIHWHCSLGVSLSVVLIIGFTPALCLLVLWSLYLSMATITGVFLGYQWDNLLLETAFASIFFAPWKGWLKGQEMTRVSLAGLWVLRWLLFRLMFLSGCVKLLSGDQTWRNLTALQVHYETQPLPTALAWYAHQLPLFFHKASVIGMFAIELVVPFLIFCPRNLRFIAAALIAGLQLVIIATGNYAFFNLLTLALCFLLLDDAALRKLLRRGPGEPIILPQNFRGLARFVIVAFLLLTAYPMASVFAGYFHVPLLTSVYGSVAPFRSFNNYGLFAVMTTNRIEISVEGSADGRDWKMYQFKYKANHAEERPHFVAPHQPRLDWQMWFAALGDYQQNRWFLAFCQRLLEGKKDVLGLLEQNPFTNAPPRLIRATRAEYRFTTNGDDSAWWQTVPDGLYCPILTLTTNTPRRLTIVSPRR